MSRVLRSRGAPTSRVVKFRYEKTHQATMEYDVHANAEFLILTVKVKIHDDIIDDIEAVCGPDETPFDRIQKELIERLK